jgi:hypothetical protein
MASYNTTPLGGGTLVNYFNGSVNGNTPVTLTNYQSNGSSLTFASYDSALGIAKLGNSGYLQNGVDISTILQPTTNAGSKLYTSPTGGTTNYTFTVPSGITSISILCVGGAGGYTRNNPPNSTWFGGSTTSPIVSGTNVICYAGGGSGSGQGAGTGTGFYVGGGSTNETLVTQATGAVFRSGGGGALGTPAGGGGAAGYSGIGGTASATGGAAPAGGGGGGGSSTRGGGGVGVYGQGASGGVGGGGGSGGGNGVTSTVRAGGLYGGGCGNSNAYGGGGGALCYVNNYAVTPGATFNITVGGGFKNTNGTGGAGGSGAVRIVWGANRTFPSTNVSSAFNETTN